MQTSDTAADGQAAALEALVADLARLEQLLAEESQASVEFNLFELLNQHRREEAHSRVLTWLLNPGGNHGLGDHFLKNFLLVTGYKRDIGDNSDWSQATSQREWFHEIDEARGSLDILVVDASKRFLCAVENKIYHTETAGQLNRYRRALEQKYPNFTKHRVFLTLAGTSPQSEDEQEHWRCASYTDILALVERSIDECASEMRDDVRVFLQHYANTVRRIIVPESPEIRHLSRKIYLEHRDAIERVSRHKPNYKGEIKQRLEEAIRERDDWKLVKPYDDPEFVSFQPCVLEDCKVFRQSAADYNRLLWFGFGFNEKGNAWFQIELAPIQSKAIRGKVIETFRRHDKLFQGEEKYDNGAVRLHESDWLLEDTDLGAGWDTGVVRDKVKQFLENEFCGMLEVIVKCLEEYEAEQNAG